MSQTNDNEFSRMERHFHTDEPSEMKLPLSDAQKLRRRVMDLDRSVCRTRQSQRRFLIQVQMASSDDAARDAVRLLNSVADAGLSGRVVDWD